MNNKQILEALQMQPLSEEEKATRHILGRLYGPIATCNSGTRNGRKYNRELWERALNDEIFKEKVKNKSLFLELGHPIDREETDMEKVCACIPEMPTIVDGDLYAYVDILDTNNGRLLKTLCDYGFVPGISSRGSGDVMPNNEVDPETFFLETWDIVQLPAVKDARLQIFESFDRNQAKLRKALTESYEQASEEEKKNMKETLDGLHIELDEPEGDVEKEPEESEVQEPAETEKEDETVDVMTVKDLKDALDGYEDDLKIEFEPIEIGGEECQITMLDFDDSEQGSLSVKLGCSRETGDDIEEVAEAEAEEENGQAEAAGEEAKKEEEGPKEAEDAGNDDLLESLKTLIRQKDELEGTIQSLKNERTVGNAEANALKEELDKYKTAFARTSEIAAKAKKFETEARRLNEQLNEKDKEIEAIKQTHAETLTESANDSKRQVAYLKEQLAEAKRQIDDAESRLSNQATDYRKKLAEQTKRTEEYRETCDEAVERYISFRASMLGVKPSEITGKLDESYSLEDIDKACDDILTEGVRISKLPYGFETKPRMKVVDSKKSTPAHKDGYDIDDSLLELAGLK